MPPQCRNYESETLKCRFSELQVCKLENQGGSYISIVIVDKY